MSSSGEVIDIKSADGVENRINIYQSASNGDSPVIVVFPAMGVAASYYEPLAQVLNGLSIHCATTDLRGLGGSSIRVKRGVDFGYNDMVTLDYPAVISAVNNRFPNSPVLLLGHSLGGQLAALFAGANPGAVTGLIVVATCSVYYKKWPVPHRYGLLFFEQMVATISRLVGYFPGHVFKFGGNEAKTQMLDWADQGWTGVYAPKGADKDYDLLLSQAEIPVLSISFADDGYCPEQACQHLVDKMGAAEITRKHFTPQELGEDWMGHFGWVKKSQALAPTIEQWIKGVLEKG